MIVRPIAQFWIVLAAVGFLVSCAAPAKVKRLVERPKPGTVRSTSLHSLLTSALTEADKDERDHALGHFVEEWKKKGLPAQETLKPDENGGAAYHVRFGSTHLGAYPLAYFDEISPAADFKIEKLEHHKQKGVGAPLVALRENRGREAVERWYPPEVIARPLTALATAGPTRGGSRTVTIDLLCPLMNPTVVQQGKRVPLAADYSVPWAAALARAGELNRLRVLDALTPTPRRKPQLYLMEPYDPNKEPLIMIHGLFSTPLAWAGLSNELWADERIRQRYQIWHYLYNTSAPALYSARLLRMQLRELRAELDPDGNDPASRKSTLLTHSMGGLVGKALVLEPKDAFWKAAFKIPHTQLILTDKDRAELTEAFEWQADRSVHRIIFIAVPHGGSAFADNFLGRIGRWITAPPRTFQQFYARISQTNPDVFTPEYALLGKGRLDSVGSLSPQQPTLRILASLPFRKDVKVHSIIGDRGRPGPREDSSDGIVTYKSSHLAGATSELVVPAGHGAFRHPDAIAEIKRILTLR